MKNPHYPSMPRRVPVSCVRHLGVRFRAGWAAIFGKLFFDHSVETSCQARQVRDIHRGVTMYSRDRSIDFAPRITRKAVSGAGFRERMLVTVAQFSVTGL